MNQRTQLLSQQLASGGAETLAELLQQTRQRLLRIIEFRLDSRLKGRLDPEDVFQEVSLVAAQRLSDYQKSADPMPAMVWLRFLAVQKTIELNRSHVGVAARSVEREVSVNQSPASASTSMELARHLMGPEPTPSSVVRQAERIELLNRAIEQLDPTDREILELRSYEQLTNEEAARVLGINSSAASSRFVRAIIRPV
jgi:RNA polymerase sigma-70 factor (subfamily 1)